VWEEVGRNPESKARLLGEIVDRLVVKRGGMVVFGTDDNYQWSTGGFGNIRELQLMRETGMHALEVLRTANLNSAKLLKEDRLGLVRPRNTEVSSCPPRRTTR
jgi:imidazolonepropionase-like amidohydrolase